MGIKLVDQQQSDVAALAGTGFVMRESQGKIFLDHTQFLPCQLCAARGDFKTQSASHLHDSSICHFEQSSTAHIGKKRQEVPRQARPGAEQLFCV